MKRLIEIVPYNLEWPKIFAVEAEEIKELLNNNCLEVHHIGSTAVPNLIAKPKIDIMIVVKDSQKARKQLEKNGIEYVGELNIPLRLFFRKRGRFNFNYHLYEKDHSGIAVNLLFRDYLRTHPQVRDAYSDLKQSLIKEEASFDINNSTFTNYTLWKGPFIQNILREAGYNSLRILKCNDEIEWKASKHFRNTYFFGPYGIEDPYTWTFNNENHAHLILYQGVDIIGYAHIQFWPKLRAAMRIVVIDESARNKNKGTEFLTLIEKWLKSLSIKSIHAESRQSSLKFYLKNGYIKMPFDDPESNNHDPNDVPVGKIYEYYRN